MDYGGGDKSLRGWMGVGRDGNKYRDKMKELWGEVWGGL